MLKVIRKGAIENPWFFRIIMGGLAVAFTVTMGWVGFGGGHENENTIAQVDRTPIHLEEYHRAYQNASNFYREIFQDKYDDKDLRKRVIDELVDRKLWLREAQQMKLAVSDEELKRSITQLPGFQKEGKFDSDLYRRVLALEHYSPEGFERQHREELLIDKAKTLVKESVALTPTEEEEAKKSNPANPDPDRAASDLLFQKKQRALNGYTLALRQKASINVKEELL
ncbi:MAG: SurA N-terminal domain-containing protein [Nitrospirae bacterium]|nr:SurA N-terminal domain-containing protein [Candidatus Manganitrophaceae bacterium]